MGMSGGSGASYQWGPFVPSVSPLPPNQSTGGDPARVITPCFEMVTSRHRWFSWWLSYPEDWPPADLDLQSAAHDILPNFDLWEIFEFEVSSFSPASGNSRLQSVAIPEEIALWRQDSDHWMGTARYIAMATIEYAIIEGNPRLRWEVFCDDYQCFSYIIPVPPIPPAPPAISGPQQGSGHGTVFSNLLLNAVAAMTVRKRRKKYL